MNMLLPEFVVNQKAGSEIMVSLMTKGLDGLEKLIALNAQVVNMTIVDSQGAVAKALAAGPHARASSCPALTSAVP